MKLLRSVSTAAAFVLAIVASSFTLKPAERPHPVAMDYAWISFDCTSPANPIIVAPGNFVYDNPPSAQVCPDQGQRICSAKFRLKTINGQPAQATISGTTATLLSGVSPSDRLAAVKCALGQ